MHLENYTLKEFIRVKSYGKTSSNIKQDNETNSISLTSENITKDSNEPDKNLKSR
jgi:hypothetical protein